MKRFRTKLAALMFALVIVMAAFIPAGCGDDDNETIKYTLTFERSSGDPFADVNVFADSADTGRTYRGRTDKNGKFSFTAPKGEYIIEVGVPEGYKSEGHRVTDKTPNKKFTLSASLIAGPALASQTYAIGSVMHDFTFTDTLGRQNSLGNILSTKKAAVLNFWFVNCSYCVEEFPGMQAAYEQYGDKVEIIGLNFTDSAADSEAFRTNATGVWAWDELTFPMVGKEEAAPAQLKASFGVAGCPTTILIDREGVVCMTATGAGTQSEFEELFAQYSDDNYQQVIQFPEKGGQVKPDVTSPSAERIAAAINGEGFTAEYAPATDEYNWPWIIGSDNKSIVPSNTGYRNSHSILNISITATTDQILAFDYKTSSETYDYLYVYVDGDLVNAFSGIMDDFKTCYACIPVKAGKFTVSVAYIKDSSRDNGDDTVIIKNMRFVDAVGERTEMPYRCAGGDRDSYGDFTEYVTPVYNKNDGYYHVGTENGPLVVADLLNNIKWSDRSAWDYVSGGVELKADLDGDGEEENYTEIFGHYVTVSNNAERSGKVAVTEELKKSLVVLTGMFGNKHDNQNEWLDLCFYYVVYAGEQDEILPDPAQGLSFHNALPSVITPLGEEPKLIHVVKKKPLMPRGIYYSIVPETTAVYKIHSVGEVDTEGWLIDEDYNELAYSDNSDNPVDSDLYNFSMSVLLKKDTKYCVMVDFNAVDAIGEFDFVIEQLGTSGSVWTPAAAGGYDGILDDEGNMVGFEVAGAVDYVLGDDNCYHVKNEDGSVGPLLYVSLLDSTNIFPSQSIEMMLSIDSYYCTQCGSVYPSSVKAFETATSVMCYCGNTVKSSFVKNKPFNLPTPLVDTQGRVPTIVYQRDTGDGYYLYQYVAMYDLNTEDDIGSQDKYLQHLRQDGIKFTDYTTVIQKYVSDAKIAAKCAKDENELGGANGQAYIGNIPATEELVDILQKFIIFGDHSMSPQIGNAWLMMANYFLPLG